MRRELRCSYSWTAISRNSVRDRIPPCLILSAPEKRAGLRERINPGPA